MLLGFLIMSRVSTCVHIFQTSHVEPEKTGCQLFLCKCAFWNNTGQTYCSQQKISTGGQWEGLFKNTHLPLGKYFNKMHNGRKCIQVCPILSSNAKRITFVSFLYFLEYINHSLLTLFRKVNCQQWPAEIECIKIALECNSLSTEVDRLAWQQVKNAIKAQNMARFTRECTNMLFLVYTDTVVIIYVTLSPQSV